jgi:tetratricopeptide (TPR) repeat protein
MKITSTLALAATLATGGALLAGPAVAQKKGQQAAAQQPAAGAAQQRKFEFSKEARAALGPLQTAASGTDPAAFQTALAAAQAVAKNADDRYFIAQMQLKFAQATNNEAGKSAAVDAIIASGAAQPSELLPLYRAQADLAANAKNYGKAVTAYQKVLELQPGDQTVLNNLIILQRQNKNYPQAIALVRQAIAASKASGQPAPENLYRLGLQTALDANMKNELIPLSREFVSAYPTAKNWQTALDIYGQSVGNNDELLLDTYRLMRRAKTMTDARQYIALADTLARGRYYAEARDVVNEGISAGKYNASNASAAAILKEVSPRISSDKAALAGLEGRARSDGNGASALKLADAYFGHGDYTKAADFYRLALQKGGVDAGLANTRLGMALGQSGNKAGAEAAFKAVTGPRADLAGFWMLWMNQRG